MGRYRCAQSTSHDRRWWLVPASICMMVLGFTLHAQAFVVSDLLRCSDLIGFDARMGVACGGDNLVSGSVAITPSGAVAVNVQGALPDPFVLYEVYWLPSGEPVPNAILLGNFTTDCHGNSGMLLRTISAPIHQILGSPIDITTLVGPFDSGLFLVYSRGPMGFDDFDADCRPDTLNTVPPGTDPILPLANPPVNLPGDVLQFVSGYQN